MDKETSVIYSQVMRTTALDILIYSLLFLKTLCLNNKTTVAANNFIASSSRAALFNQASHAIFISFASERKPEIRTKASD